MCAVVDRGPTNRERRNQRQVLDGQQALISPHREVAIGRKTRFGEFRFDSIVVVNNVEIITATWTYILDLADREFAQASHAFEPANITHRFQPHARWVSPD